jgi:hypothetical protein
MNAWLLLLIVLPFGIIIPFAGYEIGKRFPGSKD